MTTINDALTRHQVYLEGLKLGTAKGFNGRIAELRDGLRRAFASLDADNMGDLTKAQINALVAEVRGLVQRVMNRYVVDVLKFLRRVMDGERELFGQIITGDPEADATPIYGPLASQGSKAGRERLWATILGAPVPGNGQYLDNMLTALALVTQAQIVNSIHKAVGNSATVAETLAALTGDKSTLFGTGVLALTYRRNETSVDMAIQHISQMVCAAVGSTMFNGFTWSSVVDGGTTPICRERDGKYFLYSTGPLPPAHYGCRAKAVPGAHDDLPVTMAAWLNLQPEDVIADLGDLASPTPLSLEAFMSKLPRILA